MPSHTAYAGPPLSVPQVGTASPPSRPGSSWDCEVCWLIVCPDFQHRYAAAPLPREYPFGSPVPSRQQPSWAGVPRPLLSALRLAVAIDMPKSPSKRERERSRPGRLNRTFTDRDRGIEGPPESTGSTASAARDEKPLSTSQQERRWQQAPPPLTLYSEVYYYHGKPPQPSPALDRILQELLEQQEAGTTIASRPGITVKSRDINRRRAKAEIIAKRLEARPQSLPPRPCLPPRRRSRPQDSEYTYYSSEEEGTAGQAKKIPDYPAGSLISRLLPTSTATAASSESGSYESSRGPRSVATHPSLMCRSIHALIIAAACSDAVPPPLRQHREQAEYADRPWQTGLRRSLSVCHPLDSSLLYIAAPSWVIKGTETWLALVCTDVSLSAVKSVKSAEGASGDLHTCCDRLLLPTTALGPAAGPMASPAAQPHAPQFRRRPRTNHHSCADTARPMQPVSEHLSQDSASLASWLIGTPNLPAEAKLHLRGQVQELHIDAMDVDEEEEHRSTLIIIDPVQ